MDAIRVIRPLCVVDCNFIQQCRGDEDDVPTQWDCLLISSLFGELAAKDEKEKAFLLDRFSKWSRRNANRLWVARDWIHLLRRYEWSFKNVRHIRVRDLVAPAQTLALRQHFSNPEAAWDADLSIYQLKQWVSDLDKNRARWVSFTDECRDFVASLDGKPSEKIPHTPEALLNYVQSCNIANLIVNRRGKGRYCDQRWRRHLEHFPDRLLMGRKMRLDLYYMLRRSLGDSRKFENNWDDAHYAIAASYTGLIATRDTRLIKACEVLSPGIRAFPACQKADSNRL